MQAINFSSIYALQAQAAQNTKPSSQKPAFPASSSFKPSGKPIAALAAQALGACAKPFASCHTPAPFKTSSNVQSSFQHENRVLAFESF
jgi:hypothetical protein